ncbi:hypothetical protein [Chitiniphilus eburneus]|uniref:hypothetical protein n=1 Tax=Chitiniphilus eburneus TaxID=2571148 RepID=UPI00145CE801|nr:hypothetical protein [Chitiniphilus eburneus]
MPRLPLLVALLSLLAGCATPPPGDAPAPQPTAAVGGGWTPVVVPVLWQPV